MKLASLVKFCGFIAVVVLPLFNLPLIFTIWSRRSSKDISMCWALGVFLGFVLMLPSGITSTDFVFRLQSISNVVFFGAVLIFVIRYR